MTDDFPLPMKEPEDEERAVEALVLNPIDYQALQGVAGVLGCCEPRDVLRARHRDAVLIVSTVVPPGKPVEVYDLDAFLEEYPALRGA